MAVEIAVVPVAGLGTRLAPLSQAVPKELLPLGRKPALLHIVEQLTDAGIREIVFVTTRRKKAIEVFFTEQVPSLAQFHFVEQPQQRGLGDAIACAADVVKAPFVVALGDAVIGTHPKSNVVRRMIDSFESRTAQAVISFESVARELVSRFGIAKPKDERGEVFELDDIVEKPSLDEAPSNLAVSGRYVFSPTIFQRLAETKPGKDGEIQLTDAIRSCIHDGGAVMGVRLRDDEPRYDVGNFGSYYRAYFAHALADAEYRNDLMRVIEEEIERGR